jgi:hypothetical protein
VHNCRDAMRISKGFYCTTAVYYWYVVCLVPLHCYVDGSCFFAECVGEAEWLSTATIHDNNSKSVLRASRSRDHHACVLISFVDYSYEYMDSTCTVRTYSTVLVGMCDVRARNAPFIDSFEQFIISSKSSLGIIDYY